MIFEVAGNHRIGRQRRVGGSRRASAARAGRRAATGARRGLAAALAVVSLCWLAAVLVAYAQESPAERHVKRATAYYDLEQYDNAIREFEKAYQLNQQPTLLINIAQSHWKNGDKRAAVEFYRKYLVAAPKGKYASFAKEQIERLSAEIAAEPEPDGGDDAADPKQDLSDAGDGGGDDAEPAAEAGLADGAGPVAVAELPAERPADTRVDAGTRGRTQRFAGIAGAGVGVALIGVGAIFGLEARSIAGELDNVQWSAELDARRAEGESAERTAFVLWGVGAAAVVAGGVVYYLGWRAERRGAGVAVVPAVTADAAGLVATGRF